MKLFATQTSLLHDKCRLTTFALLFLAAGMSFQTSAKEPDRYPSVPSEQISVNGIELGSTDSDVFKHLGKAISRVLEPPQFSAVEISYKYDGMLLHTTDNSVVSISISSDTYSLSNGITVGETKQELVRKMNLWWKDNIGWAAIGKSNSCFIQISTHENIVSKIFIYCAG